MQAAVKERPVIFSGESVRAILAGRKTQTRRVIKPQPEPWSDNPAFLVWKRRGYEHGPLTMRHIEAAFGAPGDRLWVRETYAIESNRGLDSAERYPPPFGADHPIEWHEDEDEGRWWQQCHYRASDTPPDLCCEDVDCRSCGDPGPGYGPHWRSPLFMPRWASRLTLEVVAVRPERLQEISEEDAIAEGYTGTEGGGHPAGDDYVTPAEEYRLAWDALNRRQRVRDPETGRWTIRQGILWSSNPWVWATTFRRLS